MSAQKSLPLPSPAPSNSVVINPRCSLWMEADQRVIVVAGLPVHHYRTEDAAAGLWLFGANRTAQSSALEAYTMVFLVDSGFAQQTEVARPKPEWQRSVTRAVGVA